MVELLISCPKCSRRFSVLHPKPRTSDVAVPHHDIVRGVECPASGQPTAVVAFAPWQGQSSLLNDLQVFC
jgi:hypothetical protein